MNYKMKIFLSTVLLSISILASAQKNDLSRIISINTKFEIELIPFENNKFQYKIVERKVFNKFIKDKTTDDLFDSIVPDNKIQGVFAYGDFGGRKSVLLILKSGLNDVIDYYLQIKLPKKRKFKKTSTVEIYKGIRSMEYWPYDIESIEFIDFKSIPNEQFEPFDFEIKIDSTCIKNSDKNIEFGEREFSTHLKSVISELNDNKNFELEKMIEYENSINSEDVSLGHYWSLGEGIYPNEKEFKFGNPISFRRFECPYFEGRTNYFYTKNDKQIKVVSFNWETFKESNFGINPAIKKDLKEKFNNKYDFIVKVVSELLGSPLNIEQELDSGRIDTKWKSTSGINAYLFKFKDYNELRLYIYKD